MKREKNVFKMRSICRDVVASAPRMTIFCLLANCFACFFFFFFELMILLYVGLLSFYSLYITLAICKADLVSFKMKTNENFDRHPHTLRLDEEIL
jgi:hypothetical protein